VRHDNLNDGGSRARSIRWRCTRSAFDLVRVFPVGTLVTVHPRVQGRMPHL